MWRNQQATNSRPSHVIRKSVTKPMNNSNHSSNIKSFIPKKHAQMIDTMNIRSFDYHVQGEGQEAMIIFDIYMYDNNQQNHTFDYCVKNETIPGGNQDDKAYDIFSVAASVLPIYDEGLSNAEGSQKRNHDHYLVQQLKDVVYSAGLQFVKEEDLNNSAKAAGATGGNAIPTVLCVLHQEERTLIKDDQNTGIYDLRAQTLTTEIGLINQKVEVEKDCLWLCGAELKVVNGETVSTPYYLKLKITNYTINTLYCVAGRVTNTDKYVPWAEQDYYAEDTQNKYMYKEENGVFVPQFIFNVTNSMEPMTGTTGESIIPTTIKQKIGTNCLIKYNKTEQESYDSSILNIIMNYPQQENACFEFGESFDYKNNEALKDIITIVEFQNKPGNTYVSSQIGQIEIKANSTTNEEIPYKQVNVIKTYESIVFISCERLWLEVKKENEDLALAYMIKGIEYYKKPDQQSTEYEKIKPKLDWYYPDTETGYPLAQPSTGNTTWTEEDCKKLCEICMQRQQPESVIVERMGVYRGINPIQGEFDYKLDYVHNLKFDQSIIRDEQNPTKYQFYVMCEFVNCDNTCKYRDWEKYQGITHSSEMYDPTMINHPVIKVIRKAPGRGATREEVFGGEDIYMVIARANGFINDPFEDVLVEGNNCANTNFNWTGYNMKYTGSNATIGNVLVQFNSDGDIDNPKVKDWNFALQKEGLDTEDLPWFFVRSQDYWPYIASQEEGINQGRDDNKTYRQTKNGGDEDPVEETVYYKDKTNGMIGAMRDSDYFWNIFKNPNELTREDIDGCLAILEMIYRLEYIFYKGESTKTTPALTNAAATYISNLEYQIVRLADEMNANDLDGMKTYIKNGFEVFYDFYKEDIDQITIDDITNSDFEIVEEKAIYKVLYAKNDVTTLIDNPKAEDSTALDNFILSIINSLEKQLEIENGTYEIEDMVCYEEPTLNTNGTTTVSVDAIIEYSQMLTLIQDERNKIQRRGETDKFVLMFNQTEKGTFFEILPPESENNAATRSAHIGFFISSSNSDTQHNIPSKNPRGRIPGDNENYVVNIFKYFYDQEPLDWRNDNYYSNVIYLMNNDNVSIQFVEEMGDLFTALGNVEVSTGQYEPSTYPNQANKPLVEQNMIGYYILKRTGTN